ncbi:MAG: S8 family serine peptidase, partial [Verrucomicrobiales bacterium]|nr:S8 family serine peptidase [Verrucomicrobiales bacterium]
DLPLPTTPKEGYLRWDRAQRRVDADIRAWPLAKALEKIAAATGWTVRVEPGMDTTVSARFSRRPERQALAALLGDVDFALIPSPDGKRRLLVFRSSSENATLDVSPREDTSDAAAPGALPKELIVRLKKGSKEDIHALAKRLGARVAGSIDALGAHRLVFDDAEAAQRARIELADNESVESVESNYAIGSPTQIERASGINPPPVGLKARPMQDGSSVIVALLDTAVPTAGLAHSDFLLPGVSVAGSASAENGLSHGPAMFETVIQGLSLTQKAESGQPVRVLPIDVYGGRTETSSFEIAQGVVVALERGADVINMSLAGPTSSPILHDVLRQASQAGVIAFAAPGNQPTTTPNYPAAYPEVLAVTASDRRGGIASYANRGDFVDLIAPGTSVVPYQGESYVVNGTSVATAYTAGLAAGLLADTGKPAADIVRQLQSRIGFVPPKTP